jgi:uncharacterized membrane protein YccC
MVTTGAVMVVIVAVVVVPVVIVRVGHRMARGERLIRPPEYTICYLSAMPRMERALGTVRTATALAAPRPAYAAGVRGAIATVLPLVADAAFAIGGGTWMSLGGFNGALADRGGAYRARAATMAAVTLAGALAVLVGSLAGGRLLFAIPLVLVMGTFAGLARVWGAAGVSIGGAALSTLVIALAEPARTPGEALVRAGFTVVGGLIAMSIALVVWPLRPFRPARVAISRGYEALASYADELANYNRAHGNGTTAELPAGSAAVRATLENARAVLAEMRRGRPGTTGREQHLIVLGAGVDQLFGHLVAVGETVDSIIPAERIPAADTAITATFEQVATTARELANAVLVERHSPEVHVRWSGDAVRATMNLSPSSSAALAHYDHAAGILDRAAQYAGTASVTVQALEGGHPPAGVPGASAMDVADEQSDAWSLLRAVLAPESLILRHALRLAVVTTIAVSLAEAFHLKRGYWLTITVVVMLQPYTSATTNRALQRVLGTVLGGVLTALLGAAFHDPRAILVLSFVFAAACIALLPVNYAAYSVFLTPTFVLLAEAGAGDWHLASARVINTLLGGALALAGARLLWPSPESQRLPGYLAAALAASRDYLASVVSLFDDRSVEAGERIRAARRGIGLAAVNAEESFQRLVAEYDGPPAELSPVMTFLTYTRRLSASTAALAMARHTDTVLGAAALQPFARRAEAVLDDLEQAAREQRRPAPLPILVQGAELDRQAAPLLRARVDRLARQIRMLHDALDRWAGDGTQEGPASR